MAITARGRRALTLTGKYDPFGPEFHDLDQGPDPRLADLRNSLEYMAQKTGTGNALFFWLSRRCQLLPNQKTTPCVQCSRQTGRQPQGKGASSRPSGTNSLALCSIQLGTQALGGVFVLKENDEKVVGHAKIFQEIRRLLVGMNSCLAKKPQRAALGNQFRVRLSWKYSRLEKPSRVPPPDSGSTHRLH